MKLAPAPAMGTMIMTPRMVDLQVYSVVFFWGGLVITKGSSGRKHHRCKQGSVETRVPFIWGAS